MNLFVDLFLGTLGIGCGILIVVGLAVVFCLMIIDWIFRGSE